MKIQFLISAFSLLVLFCNAQNPVGKWFHQSAIIETVNGKKTDYMEAFYKKHPCMKTSYYVFETNKQVKEFTPDCTEAESSEFDIGGSTWKIEGKSISMTFHDDATAAAVYQVEYKGDNIMIWKYTYPAVNKPEDIKSLTMIFNKVSK